MSRPADVFAAVRPVLLAERKLCKPEDADLVMKERAPLPSRLIGVLALPLGSSGLENALRALFWPADVVRTVAMFRRWVELSRSGSAGARPLGGPVLPCTDRTAG